MDFSTNPSGMGKGAVPMPIGTGHPKKGCVDDNFLEAIVVILEVKRNLYFQQSCLQEMVHWSTMNESLITYSTKKYI